MKSKRPVPVEDFGSDHWTTFGYIACAVTGRAGVPDRNRMRTDVSRHPFLAGPLRMSGGNFDKKYPTRLKGGRELSGHDDWDCASDLEAAGLVEWNGTGVNPVFGLTARGWEVFKEYTAYRTAGGNSADFSPTPPPAPAARETEE